MRLVLKLLLGLGTAEKDFEPTVWNLLGTAFALMIVFFGSLITIIYIISKII